MQNACDSGSYASWKKYVELVGRQGHKPSDLLDFEYKNAQVDVDLLKALPIYANVWSPGISLGALSPEAHETLSIAMTGWCKSDSGEGGEDPARFHLGKWG